jgi:hypothetical protein
MIQKKCAVCGSEIADARSTVCCSKRCQESRTNWRRQKYLERKKREIQQGVYVPRRQEATAKVLNRSWTYDCLMNIYDDFFNKRKFIEEIAEETRRPEIEVAKKLYEIECKGFEAVSEKYRLKKLKKLMKENDNQDIYL